ncbi:MAG: SurA N-terminal domain-containing protein [Candidatus Saccharibacteria bacterium]
MKKLFNKLIKKPEEPESSRITSETLSRHRESILAGGRKFKYPIQYARHKLVINAIIISIIALILVAVVGWWQLYPSQNTSDFMYRITRVLPLPVAEVDRQPVLYGDYLMKYISSVYYLEQKEQVNLKTEDGKRQVLYIKQESMNDAISNAYAQKLADKLKLSISDVELETFLKAQRQSAEGEISQQTYDASTLEYLGWTPDEYRYSIKKDLLRRKVSYEVDKNASDVAQKAGDAIANNSAIDLKTLSSDLSTQTGLAVNYGASGLVPKSNQDGGLAMEAAKLSKGKASSVVKPTTGDGYYFVKLTDINDSQVNYEYIHIPLTEFVNQLKGVTDSGKVKKYISL